MGRLISGLVVGLLLSVALIGGELWPFSSFELFSQVRTGERVSYEVFAVDTDGTSTPIGLRAIEAHDVRARQLVGSLSSEPRDEQIRVLRTWLTATGDGSASGARVERVVARLTLDGEGTTEEIGRRVVVEVDL